jgi:hypothetical protein
MIVFYCRKETKEILLEEIILYKLIRKLNNGNEKTFWFNYIIIIENDYFINFMNNYDDINIFFLILSLFLNFCINFYLFINKIINKTSNKFHLFFIYNFKDFILIFKKRMRIISKNYI